MKMARSSCSRSTTTCPWHGNFDCKESFQYASPSKPEEQELVRQELNEDGKIKLFEIYNDVHGTGIFDCMESFQYASPSNPEKQEL